MGIIGVNVYCLKAKYNFYLKVKSILVKNAESSLKHVLYTLPDTKSHLYKLWTAKPGQVQHPQGAYSSKYLTGNL